MFENYLMLKIIEEKYKELKLDKKDINNIFWKIVEFEGNAIGLIGEKFIRELFNYYGIKILINNNKTIHNEYDVIVDTGKKLYLEIKTARQGRKNPTFQFNGINPNYNYDYLICIGITQSEILYKIISKHNDFVYIHDKTNRGHWVKIDDENQKKLVSMNPNNNVNYKLTLNITSMKSISNFKDEIVNLIK
ncbi:hypothetical protein [Mycoplasmopsis felis]|uniref:hypothetical protein n=1 Tax=Mycoplasmopsis felis TaxID=33923 RepID=UPI002AFDF03E|nr:hypothetical protein [Mycoplasmopsis felis]WQQ03112.1 hypothetical protein RRG38_03090 [Mycoplasmopsis felis]